MRTIKVRGDGNQWIELPPCAREELLKWYDRAKIGDMKKGVIANLENRHAYDYKFEGGIYLTQRNPNHPDSPPREVQVIYVGAVETDSNW